MVTDEQVRLLRHRRMEGKTQEAAAAAAGMSVRTARTWETGPLPSGSQERRWWRTRADPFDGIWESEVVPLLVEDPKGKLQAKTILEELIARHPGEFAEGQLRTLQRRVRDYRALQGPDREVFFEQEHVPGREAAFDFTHMDDLGVTIAGQAFSHLLFVMKLSFSGWTFACLALGETFEAMVHGIQEGLRKLDGVPSVLRSDNLSAATHELKGGGGRGLTKRYQALLEHYGLRSTRIRPGMPNENGVAEKAHHLLKTAIEQALLLRGQRDFADLSAYVAFLDGVLAKHNGKQRVVERLAIERNHLGALPKTNVPEYTTYEATVRRWSTVRIGHHLYSVPSRLIGHKVELRQHADVVDVLYKGRLIERMPRLRGKRAARIDYHHIIWSLVKKPGAFARYRYREELFPSLTFRKAYDHLKQHKGERCDVEYVRILHLAASTMEADVERTLRDLLDQSAPFDFAVVKERVAPRKATVPDVKIGQPDLSRYDTLIGGAP